MNNQTKLITGIAVATALFGLAAALQAQNSGDDPGGAALVTDRFGEIFLAAVTSRGDPLPCADELARTAEFVQMQCEECHPPEWPVL